MMKVYILYEYEPYESPYNIWIYKSKQSAETELKKRKKNNKEPEYYSYWITEYEVKD